MARFQVSWFEVHSATGIMEADSKEHLLQILADEGVASAEDVDTECSHILKLDEGCWVDGENVVDEIRAAEEAIHNDWIFELEKDK